MYNIIYILYRNILYIYIYIYKLYNYMKLPNIKWSYIQLKTYCKHSHSDLLKTLPSSGIKNYIKISQRQCSRKTAVKELDKME